MSICAFHDLKGERLCFKALDIKDTEEIHCFASDPNVKRFIGWPLMTTLEETRSHIEKMLKNESEGTHLYASVIIKATGKIIGTVMIFNFSQADNYAEIGYVFHADSWGKGYGTEAISLVSNFAFDCLNLHRLNARIVDVNIGSARVLEKNGFMLEGRLRDYYNIDGSYHDGLFFGRLNEK